MSILWGNHKIPSSIGKDVYHSEGLILPDKRLAATGRIHHLTINELRSFSTVQTAPSHPCTIPASRPDQLKVDVHLPTGTKTGPMDRNLYIVFIKQDADTSQKIPLYLDPQAVISVQPCHIQLDVSHILSFYL